MAEHYKPICSIHGKKTLCDYDDHFIYVCGKCDPDYLESVGNNVIRRKDLNMSNNFESSKDVFRLWISNLTDRELEHIENDIKLNVEYRKHRPKSTADAFDDIINKNFNQ